MDHRSEILGCRVCETIEDVTAQGFCPAHQREKAVAEMKKATQDRWPGPAPACLDVFRDDTDGGLCEVCQQLVTSGMHAFVLVEKFGTFKASYRNPIHGECAALVLANPAAIFEAIKGDAV